MRRRSLLALGSVLAIAVGACGDNGTGPDGNGNGGGAQAIATGTWTATAPAGFTVVFTVSSGADYITEAQFNFSGVSCGGQTLSSGSIKTSSEPGWAVSNRQFTVSLSTPPLSITGTFADNGTEASGTWQWGSCSGDWTATHG